ncbi:hypothetical protein HanXRQr2_Chr05g0196531 [Helianthus annuus]|uniref:Uncharacterized protein n=1 Tax=Helianthus annuus TaxID=4232 RepID=A0A9K3NM63_HELAN|nr:hypothetical protein HanXRQr2_Chr05g0196531 [Helianthus annuus]
MTTLRSNSTETRHLRRRRFNRLFTNRIRSFRKQQNIRKFTVSPFRIDVNRLLLRCVRFQKRRYL